MADSHSRYDENWNYVEKIYEVSSQAWSIVSNGDNCDLLIELTTMLLYACLNYSYML